MILYAALLLTAMLLNAGEKRMLALALAVGAGIFFPVPDAGFYLVCALIETLVLLLAIRIDAQASVLIVRMSAMLIVFHGLGWLLNGYPAGSPYHMGVKLLEHAELVACILLSNQVTKRFSYV
jgi:hypothetical protein